MPITDDKRREVAEKMRGYDGSGFKESAIVPFLDCLGVGYLNWREVLDSLADLIDIPTCVMTDVGGDFENSFQCSNCMNEFDMPDFDRYPYKRCPECGAVVIDED